MRVSKVMTVLALHIAFTLALVAVIIHYWEQATTSMSACYADGLVGCHLEFDGLELNAYGREPIAATIDIPSTNPTTGEETK